MKCWNCRCIITLSRGSSLAASLPRARTSHRARRVRAPLPPHIELAMRDVDVVRLLRDDGDGEAGARSPPKTPNVTSEKMDSAARAREDARVAKAKGDAHVQVRDEPCLDRCRARVRIRATRPGQRPTRDRPASTAPPVSRDGPSPANKARDFFSDSHATFCSPPRRPVASRTPTPRTAERSCFSTRPLRETTPTRRSWKRACFPIAR